MTKLPPGWRRAPPGLACTVRIGRNRHGPLTRETCWAPARWYNARKQQARCAKHKPRARKP